MVLNVSKVRVGVRVREYGLRMYTCTKEVAKQPNHTTETFQYVATPLHVLT